MGTRAIAIIILDIGSKRNAREETAVLWGAILLLKFRRKIEVHLSLILLLSRVQSSRSSEIFRTMLIGLETAISRISLFAILFVDNLAINKIRHSLKIADATDRQ
jgi:hypothetical protein